jgi:UDP:flavonoid glycosyltransferase YjiC (YdhE family)
MCVSQIPSHVAPVLAVVKELATFEYEVMAVASPSFRKTF